MQLFISLFDNDVGYGCKVFWFQIIHKKYIKNRFVCTPTSYIPLDRMRCFNVKIRYGCF